MTITIEVKPELAHRWRQIAEREGRALEEIAAQAAESGTETLENAHEDLPRETTIRRARGLLAGASGSVDEFMRERSECDAA